MQGDMRIELHHDAIGRLLRSKDVLDPMMERGERMAKAAGPGFEAKAFQGFDRVSVIIAPTTPEAIRAVAEDSTILTRALDAGRDGNA